MKVTALRCLVWQLAALVILSATPMISHSSQDREALLVSILCSRNSALHQQVADSFKKYLQSHISRVEFAVYYLDGSQEILSKIKKQEMDLVYTLGSRATVTALKELTETPVIAAMIFSSREFVNAPNATGVMLEFPASIQLQWLRRFLPDAKRIGVLCNLQKNRQLINKLELEAKKLELELIAVNVETPRELPAALKSLSRRADVLLGVPDKIVLSSQAAKAVLLCSFRNRIPFVGLSGSWVKAGALYTLALDYGNLGIQSAEIALRVLDGTPAGTIPLAAPRKIMYSLNLKTAQYMKLNIKPELVKAAQHIFR